MEKIEAQLIEGNIIVWDIEKGRELYKNGFYGKPLGIPKPKTPDFNAPLILDLIEAVYLVEKNILSIFQGDKELTIEKLIDYGTKN
ncbi:MAG: tRNA-intron lyase, partial [Nitrososphaerota archaeon]